jgi:Cu/Ag efflux protein CusF
MTLIRALMFGIVGLIFPMSAFAESSDIVATIRKVDPKALSLTLDDGKTYSAPEEFDFHGLQAGVKVAVFYTETEGKRVINDLQVVR